MKTGFILEGIQKQVKMSKQDWQQGLYNLHVHPEMYCNQEYHSPTVKVDERFLFGTTLPISSSSPPLIENADGLRAPTDEDGPPPSPL
jgi:hypothetical protein